MAGLRLFLVAVCALWLGGCAGALDTAPVNLVATPAVAAQEEQAPAWVYGETAVGLSFSGGGTRAAAFAHGVLLALHGEAVPDRSAGSLAERVVFVSGVSGGSVAAAYFAHRGPASVRDFRERFLIQDVEASLRTRVTPANLMRALEGGVNDRRGLPVWLDRNLFDGATFADVRGAGRPTLWLNASDIYNRNVFTFDDATFAALCSDLRAYPVSEAVAASAAVPIAFAPVLLRNYAGRCDYREPGWVTRTLANREASATVRAYAAALSGYRDASRQPQIALLDGGMTDNLGVYGLTLARAIADRPYQPMSAHSAVSLRNMLFVVVDAGRGPEGDWLARPGGPTGTQVAMASVDTMIDANIRANYDAFTRSMETWRQQLVAWRCGLSAGEVQRLRGRAGAWDCRDLTFHVVRVAFDAAPDQASYERLNRVRTSFALPEDEVDLVIAAGHDFLKADPGYRRFLASLR